MSNLMNRLAEVSGRVMARLDNMSPQEVRSMLVMQDYHGFAKARFPDKFHREVVKLHGFKPEEVQLEVVHVARDLTDEVHIHRESSAFVWCLGGRYFPDAKFAKTFVHSRWCNVRSGDEFSIPAGTPHGFTVEEGGTLHFLSVQSPPIVRENGHDDYEKFEIPTPDPAHTTDCPSYWYRNRTCTCGHTDGW